MNKSLLIGLGIVCLVVGGLVGYALHGSQSLGAPQAYQALNQQNLLNELTNNFNDITSLRNSVAATVTSTVYTLAALGANGATTSTVSTTLAAFPNAVGDLLFVSFANTTSSNISESAQSVNSSTVKVTFRNNDTVVGTQATATLYVWDIPQANAFQPAALTQ